MTKIIINYIDTVIYKIVCKNVSVTDTYVGHTTNFTKRKSQHKSMCNNINSKGYGFYVYQIIRNNGGWKNWEMILIEKYPCSDTYEALKRERYYLELLNATLNKQIPTRSYKEWNDENKDKKKIYYEDNKDKINEKKKEKKNCECGGCFTYTHKAEHLKTSKHQQFMNII